MLRWVHFISNFPKDYTEVLLATVNSIVSPPLLNDAAVLVPKPKKINDENDLCGVALVDQRMKNVRHLVFELWASSK